jgi:hypothetical protein
MVLGIVEHYSQSGHANKVRINAPPYAALPKGLRP